MKHPFLLALGVGVAVIVAAFVPTLWHMVAAPPAPAPVASTEGAGLPWQVQVQPDGSSRVMGLQLGTDTLAQARARAGESWQLALVARAGEVGALEALSEPFHAGFVSARPAPAMRRWKAACVASS